MSIAFMKKVNPASADVHGSTRLAEKSGAALVGNGRVWRQLRSAGGSLGGIRGRPTARLEGAASIRQRPANQARLALVMATVSVCVTGACRRLDDDGDDADDTVLIPVVNWGTPPPDAGLPDAGEVVVCGEGC